MTRFSLAHSCLAALLLVLAAFDAFAQESPPPSPATPVDAALTQAESLLAAARAGKLEAADAEAAAGLLDHDDPFVAGIAEWALATKVNNENDGQVARWPAADPPAWFVRWSRLDGEFLLQCDYVRQAVVWGVHRDSAGLRGSLGLILRRARGSLADGRARGIPAADSVRLETQLAQLEALREQFSARLADAPDDLPGQRRLWLAARRTARGIVLANPAVRLDQLAFVQCHPASFPNITGSQYPWGHKPGGDICVQSGLHPGAPVRNLLDGRLGPGHAHGLDLAWDADRLVFGYAQQPDWPPPWDTLSGDNVFQLRGSQEPTHIFEIGLDGGGLRQVTDHSYWSDFEPTYLPDGGIVFASDRSGRSSECGKFSADHTVINLYAVGPDGGPPRRLNDNKDIDRYPHTLDNGLVGYTRWEYQERHFLEVHSLWTVRPDGTQADALYKQHMPAPYGLRDTRSIPGTSRLVSIATGHHTLAYGPVVIVDPTRGINAPDGLRIVTPGVKPQEGKMAGVPVAEGGVPDACGVYQTPWALSDTCFLVSYSYHSSTRANGFALYVIDVFGNKELVHRDLIYSCSFPMPVRPRPRPPRVAPTADASQPTGTCYVADVYRGLKGIPRGSVRYLRISQRVGWPLDEQVGAMRYLPGNAWEKQFGYWEWAPVRVLGVVPVQADGSAHFTIPADTSVYFQALDENGMELRRMRSHITLQGGEVRGCVGCHESSGHAPAVAGAVGSASGSPAVGIAVAAPAAGIPLALTSPAEVPVPPPWGADRLVGYERLIQPILDQHCVRCHGDRQPDGGLDLTATRAADGFVQSFRTLFGLHSAGSTSTAGVGPGARPLVSVSNRFSGAAVTKPLEFGSHQSPLVRVLLEDELHRREAPLTRDQWWTLVTWIDANAPYHDTFFNRRPAEGGPPERTIVWTETTAPRARVRN